MMPPHGGNVGHHPGNILAISPDLLQRVCCGSSWRQSLVATHWGLAVLALWYTKLVYWNAAEACYVQPCYEGPGLQELWKVNKGVTWTGQTSGWFFVLHAAAGVVLFGKGSDPTILREAHFVVGVFCGASLCGALLSLHMVYVWGAETNLMLNLEKLNPNGRVFEESGRHMATNQALNRTFFELATLGSFLCLLQILVVVQLVAARREFARYFRLLRGGGGGEGYSDVGDALALTESASSDGPQEARPLRANTFQV